MGANTFGQTEAARELFRNHSLRVITENNVQFVPGRLEIVQQALGVSHAARPGDGDNDLQCKNDYRFLKPLVSPDLSGKIR